MQKKQLEEFVSFYYSLLDNLAPIEKLQAFFNEEQFEIVEGEMILDSFEKYNTWYENTKEIFSQREHIINKMELLKKDEFFELIIDMDFVATKSTGEKVEIKNANIVWQVIDLDNQFKIKRYEINI